MEAFETICLNRCAGLMVGVAIVLFVFGFILKLREQGIYPLRKVIRLSRRPWFEVALLAFFIGGLVQYGATKGLNGRDQGELMGMMRSIEPGVETVALGIAWPPAMSFTNDCIDIFGCNRLANNGWWRLAQLDVSQIGSNAIVEFAYADLPTNAMSATAFYRLAAQDDFGSMERMPWWGFKTSG